MNPHPPREQIVRAWHKAGAGLRSSVLSNQEQEKGSTILKKDTVYTFLDKIEQEARKNENEHLREALLNALKECRTWIELPWAEMEQPLTKKVEEMNTEAEKLDKKKQQASLSEAEEARLHELAALYWIVYFPFRQKIWPTVRRARRERKDRAREKAEPN